jgi:SAM-dependent methyltransferase
MSLHLAIAAVSAGILGYEVLLMRLFAIVQWQHFAYMVISVALLGFGASGTMLALAQDRLKPRFVLVFAVAAGLFGITAVAGFGLAQRLPFNALALVWEPRQLLYLLVMYLLFTVPFFCGATCIGLTLMTFGERIGRIYRTNMVGSGLGALGILLALFVITPSDGLRLIAGLGLAAAALVCLGKPWVATGLAVAAVLLPLLVPASWIALHLSPYKGLSLALTVPGTEVLEQLSSPLGLVTVVASPAVPLRHAPGLSLNSAIEPPAQLGLFTDGDGLSVITAYDGRRAPLAYLDDTTAALPYHLLDRPRVLVLGAGGGADVLQAIVHHAARIDAVELNPQVVRLVAETHADFAGGLYRRPEVRVHVAEARSFVAGATARWDLIQIPLLDSLAASTAGVYGLSESYLYTVEAFRAYLRRLRPGGILAVTRWLKLPPRDSLKLFATALAALEAEGAADPARRLALIRGWNTTTLMVRNGAFGADAAATVRDFAAARSFDLAYLPGLGAEAANRWNVLEAPYFFDGAVALAGKGAAEYAGRYKFDIAPADDDRPYFFDFFRWRALPEFLALRGRGGAALLEWGYPILFATLAQAAALSLVLILLPLWLRRRRPATGRWRIGAYFLALGLAFLLVEIAFIQRFIVFLGHPLYAVAVVLTGFLVFAGFGSGAAAGFAEWLERRRPARPRFSAIEVAVCGIAATALAYLALLPPLFAWLLPLADAAKVGVSLVLIAPLGFAMGMPFPLGLARVSARLPDLVPWAWGVNGCASVIGAVAATILAIHLGFTAVIAIAAALYLAAAAVFRAPLADAAS